VGLKIQNDYPIGRYDLRDSVVLITGAAAGIGRALAEAFADQATRLVLVDRDPGVEAVARELGDGHVGLTLDVSEEASAEQAVETALQRFGRLDVLVNNAGIGPLAPAEAYPTAEWDRTFAINLRASFLFARAAARPMLAQQRGRIVNMASQAAAIGIEGHVAYCASKAGLLGMTRCMALEWGPKGITVNTVSPTVVETELGLSGWAGEKGDRARAAIPTRRFAKPWEVAATVLHLASPGAAMINGADIAIDGGYTIV
jgi:NAD(P)-dependent dehydrogenase (short-subunit alcohol dehydrogenase family)